MDRDKRQELVELSGQVINGMMSADGSIIQKAFDFAFRNHAAHAAVHIAAKMLEEIDSFEKGNIRERYRRLSETEWFKKHYEDKSLGDTIEEAD